jgi:uncharacterized protein (DUF1778 family)
LIRGYNGDTLWPVAKSRRKVQKNPLKDEVVRMRVSAEQKEALTEAAKQEGLDLSVWLRQLALRAAHALPESK